MSKDSKKALLIGLGATAAIAAVAVFISLDEDAVNKIEAQINRKKVKHFVKNKLDGSQKTLDAVDKFSDNQINAFIGVIDKTADFKDSAEDVFADLTDKATEYKDNLTKKFSKK